MSEKLGNNTEGSPEFRGNPTLSGPAGSVGQIVFPELAIKIARDLKERFGESSVAAQILQELEEGSLDAVITATWLPNSDGKISVDFCLTLLTEASEAALADYVRAIGLSVELRRLIEVTMARYREDRAAVVGKVALTGSNPPLQP